MDSQDFQGGLTEHDYNEIREADRLAAIQNYNTIMTRGFNMDHGITEVVYTTRAELRDTGKGSAPPCFYAPLDIYDLPKQIQHVTLDELRIPAKEPLLEELFSSVVTLQSPHKFMNDEQLYLFKHYEHILGADSMWNEIQILSRLPNHPNILGLECVVTTNPLYDGHLDLVHEADATEPRVVGFTQFYYPGMDQEFKLEWAEQLLDSVNFLHLEHGIAHNNISITNLAVNKSTNEILLTGFEKAIRIGTIMSVPYPDDLQQGNEKQYYSWNTLATVDKDMDDVLALIYELVTGNRVKYAFIRNSGIYRLRKGEVDKILQEASWDKEGHYKLDSPIKEYYWLILDWVSSRNKHSKKKVLQHHSDTKKPLSYVHSMPGLPDLQEENGRVKDWVWEFQVPWVDWSRPAPWKRDKSRELTGRGKYVTADYPPAGTGDVLA
ncbi:hypothetical protein QBC40DRAFT_292609 [Triangularia verruculosa]|uniref:Protein kinase domain-containing protein n=1 Tax=Triangularia verruculosa TaxID=2587418 RepID=A0AAN6XUE6_9PEZI|nr:hypothetical protein QBC40DRAFT_292609 [Triangularia verruculosa]